MQITLLRKQPLTAHFERWFFRLAPSDFTAFGYFIESLEGIAIHHRSSEASDIMEVDVAKDFAAELEYVLSIYSG